MATDDELSVTFQALADPTRRAILARLAQGEATVLELAEPFQLSLPGVSKHLKVLQRAGLISQGRRAQWRPCRLEPARLRDVSDWVEHYRVIWEERFGRLDEYLRELQNEDKKVPDSALLADIRATRQVPERHPDKEKQ
jgi:DNA-binding transcriptional ArsR family regulator